jgi:hypothetical protein
MWQQEMDPLASLESTQVGGQPGDSLPEVKRVMLAYPHSHCGLNRDQCQGIPLSTTHCGVNG